MSATLAGTLLTIDTLTNEWMRLRLSRDPGCPACSDEAEPPELIDYDETCVR